MAGMSRCGTATRRSGRRHDHAAAARSRIVSHPRRSAHHRSLRELWAIQARAHREQAAGLEQYKRNLMRKDGATEEEIAAVVIPRDCPVRPYVEQVA